MFSTFDPAAFRALYWGPQDVDGATAGLDGTLHTLAFAGINGDKATWEGMSAYAAPPGGGIVMVPVRMEVTATGLGPTPWVLATSVPGLDPGVGEGIGAVVDNSAGLDFSANVQFLADVGAGFVPLNDVPQLPNPPGQTVSSFFGGFFFESPCTLDLTLSYEPCDSTTCLNLDFELGANQPTTWNLWFVLLNESYRLWSTPIPAIEPDISIPLPIPDFPAIGSIGFLTTLVNDDGILCSDFEVVDTGLSGSSVTPEQFQQLMRNRARE
jgi:hypothetical protein